MCPSSTNTIFGALTEGIKNVDSSSSIHISCLTISPLSINTVKGNRNNDEFSIF